MAKQWYVVHTYSGYENRAKQNLEETIRKRGAEDRFGDILVPAETVVEMVKGRKRESHRKFFPGYLLVQMDLDDDTWYIVKNTPKVTGFVGSATGPTPVPEEEVLRITRQIADGSMKAKPKAIYERGEGVRIIDGPFSNFNGTVEQVRGEKGKLVVSVSIFGRATPVELDFSQVEKT